MQYYSPEKMLEIIGSYLPALSSTMHKAFQHYQRVIQCSASGDFAPQYEIRTKASMVRDHAVSLLNQEYLDHGVIKPGVYNNIFCLKIEEQFVLRFKKLNKSLKPSCYPTAQAVAFSQQRSIEGFPSLPRFDFGYRVDPTWAELKSIHIVYWHGKRFIWQVDVTDQNNAGLQVIQQLPIVPTNTPDIINPFKVKEGLRKNENDRKANH